MVKTHPSSLNSRVDFVDFWPSFFAVWTHTNLFPSSTVTIAETSLPSGVVSSKASPTLNLSSVDFKIVEVLIVHSPPVSVTSIVGVDAVAAFRSKKFTPSSVRNSSYLSAVTRSYFPTALSTIFIFYKLIGREREEENVDEQ